MDASDLVYDRDPFTVSVAVSGSGSYAYKWHPATNCDFKTTDGPAIHPVCHFDYWGQWTTEFRVDVLDAGSGQKVGSAHAAVSLDGPYLGINQDGGSYHRKYVGDLMDHAATLCTHIADAPIELQVRWPGTKTWRTLQTQTTDTTGRVEFDHDINRPGFFRLHFAGNAQLRAMNSDVRHELVPGTLRVHVRGLHVTATVRSRATGDPIPHILVGIDRRSGMDSTEIDRGRTNARGRVTLVGDKATEYTIGWKATKFYLGGQRTIQLG